MKAYVVTPHLSWLVGWFGFNDPLSISVNVSCMNPLYFFAVWDSKMAVVTKNSAEHENDNTSITA